jgi:hypothetical protein
MRVEARAEQSRAEQSRAEQKQKQKQDIRRMQKGVDGLPDDETKNAATPSPPSASNPPV